MYRLLKFCRLIIVPLSILLITIPCISNFVYASTDTASSSKFIHVTSDSLRSYAVKSDGTVWGWGSGLNDRGEAEGHPNFAKRPVTIPYLNNVTKVVGGLNSFQLALREDGTVWSWGYNSEGQLGDGTNIYKSTPVPVYNLDNVISISADSHHSLALKSDGTVWEWGYLVSGSTYQTTPKQILGI